MTPQLPPTGQRWPMAIHFPRLTWLTWLTLLALPVVLSACSSAPTAHESAMGTSLREATLRQAVPATDPAAPRPALRTDGVIAAHGIDRYEQSYLRPPAPISVLNILASPTSGMGGQANAPR